MTEYTTKAVTIGDVTATVSKAKDGDAGARLEAFLKWLAEKIVDPGFGVGGQPRPDQGLPGEPIDPNNPNRPGNALPGDQPGIDNTLPPSGGRPDNTVPGAPGADNSLPGFISNNAKEIAAAILKGTACDPAQPKK